MKKAILVGVAAVALLAGPASSQPQRGAGPAMDRAQVEARVSAMFARVDANRDGFITQSEADAARTAARAQRQERRAERRAAMFARIDADGNGSISREEFTAPRAAGDRAERRDRGFARRGMRRGAGGGLAGQGFARMDADRDGRVSLSEATAIRLERFDRVDSNRDGRITREEVQAVRAERQGR